METPKKEPKTKVTMVKTEKPKMVTVQLIGNPNELLNEHTMFYSAATIDFVDGKAKIMSNVADKLRKMGMVK